MIRIVYWCSQIFTDTVKSVLIREISEIERKSFLDPYLIS